MSWRDTSASRSARTARMASDVDAQRSVTTPGVRYDPRVHEWDKTVGSLNSVLDAIIIIIIMFGQFLERR